MTRLLLIQTAHLGDVVLTTPLIRALRAGRTALELTVLAHERGADLLEPLPEVDRVWRMAKGWTPRSLAGLVPLGLRLRRSRFDAVLVAQRSFRSGLLARLTGARLRVGFAGASGAWAYSHRVPWSLEEHASRRYLRLGGPLVSRGLDKADERPRLVVPRASRAAVERTLRRAGVGAREAICCVAPGARWATKRWVPEGFAAVVETAAARGLRPILVGSAEERELCVKVNRLARGAGVVLAGLTDLLELAAVLERAEFLLANDSGPGHVAAAVGTPVVAVFGPTVPAFGFTPRGAALRVVEHPSLDCRPCHRHGPRSCPAGHFRCMKDIGSRAVMDAVDSLPFGTDTEPEAGRPGSPPGGGSP